MTYTSKKIKSISSGRDRITKEKLLMDFAVSVSGRSTCRRHKVGTVITDSTMREIRSYGYNGNWAGGPNDCDSDRIGECGCIHSECNALINAKKRDSGDILFVTLSPCINCSKMIINAGIKKVYYHEIYRLKDGINLLRKAGVKVKRL